MWEDAEARLKLSAQVPQRSAVVAAGDGAEHSTLCLCVVLCPSGRRWTCSSSSLSWASAVFTSSSSAITSSRLSTRFSPFLGLHLLLSLSHTRTRAHTHMHKHARAHIQTHIPGKLCLGGHNNDVLSGVLRLINFKSKPDFYFYFFNWRRCWNSISNSKMDFPLACLLVCSCRLT